MHVRAVAVAGMGAMAVVVAVACAHDEHGVVSPVAATPAVSAATIAPMVDAPLVPLQYVIADPTSRSGALGLTPLAPPDSKGEGNIDGFGVILDGTRLVTRASSVRAGKEVADPPLAAALRIPPWLGGGFLFRSRNALYTGATFDGPLRPLVTMPSEIDGISFGPTSMLVRSDKGERWAIELPSGARAPIVPVGAVDIAAAGDGRAVALTERGGVFVTGDSGARWSDVTASLSSRPEEIVIGDGTLWITQASGPALRVEAGGRLAIYDKAAVVKPPELRPRDARWRGDEAPIRRAMRVGIPLDDATALVVADGDLVRVNLMSGEIVSTLSAHLPPDLTCEAVRTADDVLLVCAKSSGTGGALVASHAGFDRVPVIEQTFSAPGQFFAGDDGSLVFGGPCARAKASRLVVCARTAGGAWQELDLDALAAGDGGAPLEVTRWVPKGDGGALGILAGPAAGTIDARTGDVRTWQLDGLGASVKSSIIEARGRGVGRDAGRLIDRTWSMTPAGSVRGWGDGGTAVDVAADGTVTASPFGFDRIATSGAFAFARTRDARAWQTTDRGLTWTEVAAPPTTRASGFQEPRFCSAVGCDLSSWYRVGWGAAPPAPTPPPPVAAVPPRLPRVPAQTLACARVAAAAEPKITVLARSDRSPEDLGLGAARIAVADGGGTDYTRLLFMRTVPNPVHEFDTSSDSDYPAPRAMLHGRDLREVADDAPGYRAELLALRRQVSFLAPFDPSAVVRKATLAAADVVVAARAVGLRATDVLSPDLLAPSAFVPVTPSDPAAPGDLAFGTETGLAGVIRANGRTRYGARIRAGDEVKLVSAVALAGDDVALLESGEGGAGAVLKLGAGGLVELFEVPAVTGPLAYPANPDALAVGPRGELALVRTRTSGEPPSARDPALLMTANGVVTALAPWSTLTTADDPACRGDLAGHRATLIVAGSWLRLGAGELRVHEDAPMLARIRWSASRVCLEAIELRVDDLRLAVPQRASPRGTEPPTMTMQPVESWIVARFAGAPAAARVGVIPGAEMRAPMTCALVPGVSAP